MDFDIEGGVNTTVLAAALKGLKTANPSKSISLTLPVLPIGLVQAGLDIVNACHNAGFRPDTINIMAMDYGSYYDNGGNMLLSAQQAAQATRNQTGDMIGITPMIGQNDTQGEIFTLANASALVTWAKGQSYINRAGVLVAVARQRRLPGTDLGLADVQRRVAEHLAVLVDLQGLLGRRSLNGHVGRPPRGGRPFRLRDCREPLAGCAVAPTFPSA